MKISIVTPSYNQAQFVESAMRSVLDQAHSNLEYIVIDGGSTDGSVSIIERFQEQLSWWTSEPDEGQYDALNKGFSHSTGEIMGWLNSDDLQTAWCLSVVDEIFSSFPEVEWITTLFPLRWDAHGRAVECSARRGFRRDAFFRGENLSGGDWYATGWIQQESTFWRRSLWERTGGFLDVSYSFAADFDLWGRFFNSAELVGVATPLAGFRQYGNQRSVKSVDAYRLEALRSLREHGGKPGGRMSTRLRAAANQLPITFKRRLLIPANRAVCIFDAPERRWRLTHW